MSKRNGSSSRTKSSTSQTKSSSPESLSLENRNLDEKKNVLIGDIKSLIQLIALDENNILKFLDIYKNGPKSSEYKNCIKYAKEIDLDAFNKEVNNAINFMNIKIKFTEKDIAIIFAGLYDWFESIKKHIHNLVSDC